MENLHEQKFCIFPILLHLKCWIYLTFCTYKKKDALLSNCSKESQNNIVLPEKRKNCISFITDQKQAEIFEAFISPLRLLSQTCNFEGFVETLIQEQIIMVLGDLRKNIPTQS